MHAISAAEQTVDIKKRQDTADQHAEALFAYNQVDDQVCADALVRIGEYVAELGMEGDGSYEAARAQIALEMESFDKILPYLFGRGWVLAKASKDSGGFVTSDHPVCLTWSEPSKELPPGLGYAERKLCSLCRRRSQPSAHLK